ncbi:hypothetical protein LWI28_012777 [Acer negundo]|uniref:Thaumatin-like protein n=1 Tax=Acer negundo TaxID=4023 RepID=A0AAD5NHQ3_ACENE|nr:hypothetical protein LWI28_012777 [Acer negundo]
MISFKNLYFSSFVVNTLYLLSLKSDSIHAVTFTIHNNCTYTVWAAAVPGGGRELKHGQYWVVNIGRNYSQTGRNYSQTGRIWARTNCEFDTNGIGKCETGDCNGALYCVSNSKPPFTLAEYTFRQFNNMDSFDISLVDGFNVPLEFRGTSSECKKKVIKCTADINGLCPTELRHSGGCYHPCNIFKNNQFCCYGSSSCDPTAYSKSLKDLCPDVYTYPADHATSTFSCPNGIDYKVVFCPN